MTVLITVVVPVWNGQHQIRACIESILSQTLGRSSYDIVVVDNGSSDSTASIVSEYATVKLISETREGSYNARNAALADVQSQYVAFTDADCIADTHWLMEGLKALHKYPDAGVIAGQIDLFRENEDDSETCAAFERLFSLNQREYSAAGTCVTANWFSPMSVFQQFGPFNGALKSGGDFEMARRIVVGGSRVVFAEDAIVKHPVRGRISDVLAKRRRTVGGHWLQKRAEMSLMGFAWDIALHSAYLAKKTVVTANLEPSMKLRVMGLIFLMFAIAELELLRLATGGDPKRS